MDVREKLIELPIEDALLILREEHRQRTDSYTTYLAHGGKGDPAEEVGLNALAMAISALEKTKWISVKDRLPEHGDVVVVWHTYMEHPFVCQWDERSDCWIDGKWTFGRNTITHWCYLPKPPKGE